MTAAGYPVHFTTVARWKRHGWADTDGVHPLDQARAALDSIAPLVTGDPMTKAEDVTNEAKDNFEGLSDAELLRQTARELSIAFICVAKAIELSVPLLVASRPSEVAALIDALVACGQAARYSRIDHRVGNRAMPHEGLQGPGVYPAPSKGIASACGAACGCGWGRAIGQPRQGVQ